MSTGHSETIAATVPPLSQSKQALMACPHLYLERVVNRVEEPENEYALRGTQIHRALATYINHLAQHGLAQDPQFLGDLMLEEEMLPDTVAILEGLADKFVIDPAKVFDTELHLALDEGLNPIQPDDYEINRLLLPAYEGTLDYVQSESSKAVEIFDWKSFWQIVDPDTFQAKLYPLLLFKHYPGIEHVAFHLQFVRYGVRRTVEYTRGDVPKLEKIVSAERTRQLVMHSPCYSPGYNGSQEGARPGSHCCYCPKLLTGCPIASINPYTNQSPLDRARFGAWLDQAKKANDAVLKDHVNLVGPVRFKDDNGVEYEAAFKTVTEHSYPTKCLEIVEKNDPELAGKLTLSGLSKPLEAKKRAGLAEELSKYVVESTGSRFGISKRKNGDG